MGETMFPPWAPFFFALQVDALFASRRAKPGSGVAARSDPAGSFDFVRDEGIRLNLWVVRRQRGGPWDWSLPMREQQDWDEHAKFMEDLVDEGFVILGGPLEGEDGREVLRR